MPIEYTNECAQLADVVGVEDAEALLGWVQQHPDATVDLERCAHIHPANVQVLMASRTPVRAWPADPTLAMWLSTALQPRRVTPPDLPGDLAA